MQSWWGIIKTWTTWSIRRMPGFSLGETIFVVHSRSRSRHRKPELNAIYLRAFSWNSSLLTKSFLKYLISFIGDNRVDKSRRQRLKLPPSLSFVFFSPFLLFSFLCSPVEKERRNEESNYKDKVSRLIYRYKFRGKLLIVQYLVVRRKTRSNRFSFFLTKLLLILSALL